MEEKKALKDLNLIDRFLFAEVMDDPEAVQDALSIILEQDIRLIPPAQTEKEHRVSPLAKSIRIFLNTRGENEDEVSLELVEFLHYMENTTDKAAAQAGSDRIRRIHKRVCKAKKGEAIGMRFLRELEERNTARAEGRAEGHRDDVLELLSNFGELSEDLRKQILEQEDEEILKKWLLLAARAESVEDFMKKM